LLKGFFYMTDNTRLGIGYVRATNDIDGSFGQVSSDIDTNSIVFQAKTVNQYDGDWVNIEGQLIFAKTDLPGGDIDSTTLAVDGDYYFNTSTSLGVGLAATSGDNDADSKRLSVGVVFHTDTGYALKASVAKVDADSNVDETSVRFSFVSRNF